MALIDLWIRKYFSGNAAATILQTPMTATTPPNGATIDVGDATNFPTLGAFPIVMDRGLVSEEKILCSGRSGPTLTLDTNVGRGWDNTMPSAHTRNQATVELCLDADSLNQLEEHIFNTALDHHLQYLTADRHAGINHSALVLTPGSITGDKLALGTIPGTALADQAVTSAKLDPSLPRGFITGAKAFPLTGPGIGNAFVAVNGSSCPSFTAPAGRRYKVSFTLDVSSNGLEDVIRVVIQRNGVTISDNFDAHIVVADYSYIYTVGGVCMDIPPAGAATYRLAVQRANPTGGSGQAGPGGLIMVEDIGAG